MQKQCVNTGFLEKKNVKTLDILQKPSGNIGGYEQPCRNNRSFHKNVQTLGHFVLQKMNVTILEILQKPCDKTRDFCKNNLKTVGVFTNTIYYQYGLLHKP